MNIAQLMMIGLVAGMAALAALWSYDPVLAALCAPFVASLVTLVSALIAVVNGIRAFGSERGGSLLQDRGFGNTMLTSAACRAGERQVSNQS